MHGGVGIEWFSYICSGIMLSQFLCFSIWAVWSPHPITWRIPISFFGFILLTCCLLQDSSGQFEAISIMFATVICFWALSAAIRYWFGTHLGNVQSASECDEEIYRFSIKYLFIWTTIIAILLMIGRLLKVNFLSSDGPGVTRVGLVQHLAEIVGACFLLLTPAASAFILSLTNRFGWLINSLIISFLYFLCTSIVTAITIRSSSFTNTLKSEELIVMSMVIAGSTIGTLLSVSALRWAGYRIVRQTDSSQPN